MIERFSQLPASLREKSRTVRLAGGIPALVAHPDWISPAPTMIWLHGRTAYKELDSGRYLRWIKAGIAAVAIDLPGHGERRDERAELPRHTLDVLAGAIGEIDHVVEALADPVWQGVFDLDRLGIGGMSMGGMATLRRLCEPHGFVAAAVECSCGDLHGLYDPTSGTHPWGTAFDASVVSPLDPARHLGGFVPLPLLALHATTDRIVPWSVQEKFVQRLREHYRQHGAEPSLVEVQTWGDTGAPDEHAGFGKFGAQAKDAQVEFLSRVLKQRR